MIDAAFEDDLRVWVLRVYEQRAGLRRRRADERVMRILDAERRWLVPLTLGVLIGVAAMPVLGLPGVIGTLALLYMGAIASGVRTMRRAERAERERPSPQEVAAAAVRAWQSRPLIDVDGRAHLVRIMNLARAATTHSARAALLNEVQEARQAGPLAGWHFMHDLEALLRADASALASRHPAQSRQATAATG